MVRKRYNRVKPLLKVLLLAALPLLLFLTSLHTIKERDKVWYGAGYDPEYAYLFNSLNVATFRLVGHFDHPGTPMQVFGALVLQGSRLFHPTEEGLTQAVLSNPEAYLRLLNIATAILTALAVFIAAIFILRRTKNLWYALILQLIPFISGFILYNAFARITQEAMLMIASLALATALVDWLVNSTPEKEAGYIKAFGIISGFGMASKILFAPLLIIPLLLLSNFKARKKYILFTIGAFVVFTLPIISLYPNMAWWVIKLFIFTGQYGSGEIGLVDTFSYPQNLWWIIKANPALAILFASGLLLLLMEFIVKKGVKVPLQSRFFRLLVAVVAAIGLGYLMVAKQPKESYLLPYEMVASVLLILLLFQAGKLQIRRKPRSWIPVLLTLAFAGTIVPSGLAAKKKIYSTDKNPQWETSWLATESAVHNSIRIFAHPASSPVAALFFGNAYSHWRYTEILKNLYPDTYIFNLAENKIVDWDNSPVGAAELHKSGKNRILIQGPVEVAQAMRQVLNIAGILVQDESFYEDEKQIILIAFPEKETPLTSKQSLIFSSAETQKEKSQSIDVEGFKIHGNMDCSKSFSGMCSMVTDKDHPYAFTTKSILLHPGDSIQTQVQAFGMQSKLKLIVSESNTNIVLLRSAESQGMDDQWTTHNITFVNTADSTINVFVYCLNSGNSPAWFDDFSLETSSTIRF